MANETKIITEKIKGNDRHWLNYIDKNYLSKDNLEDSEDMLLTIVKFEGEEEVKSSTGAKQNKMVLYFAEAVPKMILNLTNANTLTTLYGSHPSDWINKKIQIWNDKNVKAFGKTGGLRIRDINLSKVGEVDVSTFKQKLGLATTLDELKNIWIKFPVSARNDKELIEVKDIIKNNLSK